ncbi:c-type cytochrome [Jhaorihella thermophila]
MFKKCKACHKVDDSGKNGIGPNLFGVVGRAVASVEGFKYSEAMAALGGTWDEKNALTPSLRPPKKVVPGNKMAFAGLKKAEDRAAVIAYIIAQSGGVADAAAAEGAEPAATNASAEEAAALEEALAGFSNPPARSAEEIAAARERAAAIQAEVDAGMDYERARYHPIHFPPAINEASNEECLVCHQEILEYKPLEASPAGVPASETLAWYQTLDTYEGAQESFHYRHLESDFAKQVMNLECTFCHKGNDPREESPDMVPTRAAGTAPDVPEFTNRKMVNPSETCLLCHGAMPDPENIMGLSGPWSEVRHDFEDEENINGCLACHGEFGFRTNRHNVTYLNALNIEKLAREKSDTCYGCHGGRQWYQISYPYPRHPWPDMDTEVPEWAVDRPTSSKPEYQLPEKGAVMRPSETEFTR